MNEGEYKSTVTEISDWVWGVVQGSFSDQQTVSQILVDAAIGMIPVVGDVTAVRDLLAISIRLAKHPEKRDDKMEWVALVLTGFALLPVAGGAIKGVGKLLMREAHNATAIGNLIEPVIEVLNRVGRGDAVKFIKELDLLKHTDALKGKMAELFKRLENVITLIVRKTSWIIPDEMVDMLKLVQGGLGKLRGLIDGMVPDVLKEMNERLKILQRALYEGEYLEIPSSLAHRSREAEARLLETVIGDTVRKGGAVHYPKNKVTDYQWPKGNFPDLSKHPKAAEWIAGFHGEIRPVVLKKGTKIWRVVDENASNAGAWWFRQLPPDGRAWRQGYAVLEDWNKDKWYVELEVQRDLYAYEGIVSSQVDLTKSSKTYGQYLEGGSSQLLVDFRHPPNSHTLDRAANLTRQETHWKPEEHLGVNVPPRTIAVEQLEPHDLETKVRGAAVVSRGTAAQIRSSAAPGEDRP